MIIIVNCSGCPLGDTGQHFVVSGVFYRNCATVVTVHGERNRFDDDTRSLFTGMDMLCDVGKERAIWIDIRSETGVWSNIRRIEILNFVFGERKSFTADSKQIQSQQPLRTKMEIQRSLNTSGNDIRSHAKLNFLLILTVCRFTLTQ